MKDKKETRRIKGELIATYDQRVRHLFRLDTCVRKDGFRINYEENLGFQENDK